MRVLLILATAACSLNAQLAFEVASIHPAPPQPMGSTSVHRSTDEVRLRYLNVSLLDVIGDAFRLPRRQINGPEWLDSTRFDIVAKYPEGVGEKKVPEMLRTLLAERFGFKSHEDTKELPVYDLIVLKAGPKMKKLEDEGNGMSINSDGMKSHVSAKTTMAGFIDFLSAKLDRPIVDQTGLPGAWQFELEYAQENAPESTAPSLFTAIQEQMGLKLSPSRGPVRLIVVDHIDKAPLEN
jgi:uncharacterized protein (TIGR03435 family)